MEGHEAVSQMDKGIFRLMELEAVEALMLPTDKGESYTWSPWPPVTSEEGHSGAPRRRNSEASVEM